MARSRTRTRSATCQGDGRSRNWDDERRIRDQEEDDGVVAEVVFPNTVPPFFPTAMHIARPPEPDEYELRLAGIRAHNRWLADWCAQYPERRAGIGQIFLNDLDDAIADVRWIKEHGLRGGILLPAVPPDVTHFIPPLYSSHYDPLWAVCEDLGVVVNQHSGTGTPDYGPEPAGGVVWLTETAFFSQRSLTHMLAGGAFERFPELRFVLTEQGCAWIRQDAHAARLLPQADDQDRAHRRAQVHARPDHAHEAERVLRPATAGSG